MAQIHSYCYRPNLRFYNGLTLYECRPTDRNYIGLELECEAPEGTYIRDDDETYCPECDEYGCGCPDHHPESDYEIDSVVGDESRWFAKHDSSLRNGVEFVSHPHAPEVWLNHWEEVYGKRFRRLRVSGWRSYTPGTCGLHMHLSRSAIVSNVHLYRLARIWYAGENEVSADHDLYRSLTGRHYRMSYADPNWHEDSGKPKATALLKSPHCGPRGALNCANDSTVELRAFRGTLDTFLAKGCVSLFLESVEYARTRPVSECSLTAFVSHARNTADKDARNLIYSRVGRKSVTALRIRGIDERKRLNDKLRKEENKRRAELARLKRKKETQARKFITRLRQEGEIRVGDIVFTAENPLAWGYVDEVLGNDEFELWSHRHYARTGCMCDDCRISRRYLERDLRVMHPQSPSNVAIRAINLLSSEEDS